ncbi:MAG: hypothetical protein J6R85_06490 [Lentisphaeria bacterium]|nr:hypothetical protein [Lentisphaeria bacterium]
MKNSNRMIFSRTLGLAGLMLLTTGAVTLAEEAAAAAESASVSPLTAREAAERSKQIDQIDVQIAKADELKAQSRYNEAQKLYENALVALKGIRGTQASDRFMEVYGKYSAMCTQWGEGLYQQAAQAAKERRATVAMAFAADALSAEGKARKFAADVLEMPVGDSEFPEKISEFNELCRKIQQGDEFAAETSLEKIDATYPDRQAQIEKLIREAKTLMANKKYEDAVLRLEKVYLLDAFNTDAAYLLDRVYTKVYGAGRDRAKAEVEAELNANRWSWVMPVSPAGLENGNERQASIRSTGDDTIFARMERIVFPEVNFEDADIGTVVRYLTNRSKLYDPDKEGVNFTLMLDKDIADKLQTTTISFSNIPLSELLRYICQDFELKYRIDGDNIVIGRTVDEMQTQSFPVRGDLIANISGGAESSEGDMGMDPGMDMADPAMAGEAGVEGEGKKSAFGEDGEGEGSDDKGESFMDGTNKIRTDRVNSSKLRKYFSERGVKFDAGSSIAYNRRAGKLIVRNTADNLRRLDELLRQLDAIETPLVQVEVKLVEISEIDAQELGFEWALSVGDVAHKNHAWAADTTNPIRNSSDLSKPDVNSTTGLAQSSGDNVLVNNLKIFPNFGHGLLGDDTVVNLDLTINALSQNQRTEVLSAPKLISSSGQEASIEMVRTYFFPDEWEAPEIEEDGNFSTVTLPTPEWEDDGDKIGITLRMLPQVDPDNYTVTLELHPEIRTYIGKTDDTVRIAWGSIDYTQSTPTYVPQYDETFNVWMPIIGVRKLDVTVKVYDGETIVLGGMVDNRTKLLYDRWPILGDIPLIGRLFSSQYDETENTNLLIFVTTRLMNSDGIPIRRSSDRGMPDFSR